MMKPEKLTEQAQEMLAASQELVLQYHHNQWDVEHILLALLQQENSVPVDILKELGVDIERMRERVEQVLQHAPKVAYEGSTDIRLPLVSPACSRAPPTRPPGSRTSSWARSTCSSPWPESSRAKQPGFSRSSVSTRKRYTGPSGHPRRAARHRPQGGEQVPLAGEIQPRPDRARQGRQARPGHRAGRGDQARHADTHAPHQE